MKKRSKRLFKVVISFMFIYFILGFLIPFYTSFYGWVKVTDKYINDNIYYIDANSEGGNIKIKII